MQVLAIPDQYPGNLEIGLYDRSDYNQVKVICYSDGQQSAVLTDDLGYLGERSMDIAYRLLDEGMTRPIKLPRGTFDSAAFYGDNPLTIRELKPVCSVYGIDAVLCLEGVKSSIDTDGSINIIKNSDMVWGRGSVPVVNGSQRIESEIFVRLYDCKTGELLFENPSSSTLFIDENGESRNPDYLRLPVKDRSVANGVELAWVEWSKTKFPHWADEDRVFYYYGSAEFVEAGHHALWGEWSQAITIWEKIVRTKSGKMAGRAAFNLAVAAEVDGNLQGAIQWALMAQEKYEEPLAADYLESLRGRKKKYDDFK